jgi:hypothetical protein
MIKRKNLLPKKEKRHFGAKIKNPHQEMPKNPL